MTAVPEIHQLNVRQLVGGGYNDFYNTKKRYRVVKGGRASKKSCTAALDYIIKLPRFPGANLVVIRRYHTLHKDSTFAQLKWAIDRTGTAPLWKVTKSPLEIVYRPTKQNILFRGFDDPLGITSLTTAQGSYCWAWIEEGFQIEAEDDFNKLDLSLRGILSPGLYKQITITLNPWDENHWIKKRFFDTPDEDTYAATTTYLDNEFLAPDDYALFEKMKVKNPERYKVEGLGDWGTYSGRVYTNWSVQDFDPDELRKQPGEQERHGLDFGFSNDPMVLVSFFINDKEKKIHIYREHYQLGLVNSEIADIIKSYGLANATIVADVEPKSIEEIKREGVRRITAVKAANKKIKPGIRKLQDYEIIVHPACPEITKEFTFYRWAEKNGIKLAEPIDDYNHGLDAVRYATVTDPLSVFIGRAK